jgi:hypothetical protein
MIRKFVEQTQPHAMRAMETETIQKDGASPKSRMSRGNLLCKQNLLSVFVLIIFILGAVGSASYSGVSSSGNSSSGTSDCNLSYWVEQSSGYYIPYFKKIGNCSLSLDYALYYTSGEFFMDGHLYFTQNSSSPSSGHYAKSPIRIVIKSKKWE